MENLSALTRSNLVQNLLESFSKASRLSFMANRDPMSFFIMSTPGVIRFVVFDELIGLVHVGEVPPVPSPLPPTIGVLVCLDGDLEPRPSPENHATICNGVDVTRDDGDCYPD